MRAAARGHPRSPADLHDLRGLSGSRPVAVRTSVMASAAIFEEEAVFVRRVLRRYGLAPSELDDARQDVFLIVHSRWDTYDPSRPLRPWLYGICHRVAIALRRRRARVQYGEIPDVADPRRLPDEELAAREAAAIADRAVQSIPGDRRDVFVLSEWEATDARDRTLDGHPAQHRLFRLRLAREDFRRAIRRAA